MTLTRRHLFQLIPGALACTLVPTVAQARNRAITWHNVQDWGVEGKGWTDTNRYFSRLPSKSRRSSAGARLEFIAALCRDDGSVCYGCNSHSRQVQPDVRQAGDAAHAGDWGQRTRPVCSGR